MFYELVLKNGEIISRIPEDKYKKIDAILLMSRNDRPDFIKIEGYKRTIPWNMVADLGPDRLNWKYGVIK